nr:EspO-like indole-3-pyruvic acid imine synthase [uncultured bacterium]
MTKASSELEAQLLEFRQSCAQSRTEGRVPAPREAGPSMRIADLATGPADGTRGKVTIIGAGISGLVAAYELEQLGYSVEIWEASRRIGGRIHTHRFGSDLEAPVAELGAMRIPTHHRHTMKYICRLGLADEVRPFRSLLAEENAFLGDPTGYVRLSEAPRALFEELRRGLAQHGYRDETLLFGAQLSLVVNAIAPPAVREGLRQDLSRQLLGLADSVDLRPHIRRRQRQRLGDSVAEQIDLHAVFAAYPHLRTACHGDLRSFLDDILVETSSELVRIRGGMSRMVERLARRIRGPIHCGREVVGLDVRPGGVLIQVREGGRIVTHESEYALCTVPFSVLRRLRLGGFSEDKLDAIRTVQYVPATKVAFHCKEPFWLWEGISGGASAGGGLIRQTYYPCIDGDPALGAVLLASYTIGEDADTLGRMSPEARNAYVLTELGKMHPALLRPGMVMGAVSAAWGQHRWSSGGCSVRWGKDTAAVEEERARVTEPQGALFFAGEHCSSAPAWIDGAIESAIDAVGRIVQYDTPAQRTRMVREAVSHSA